MTAASAKSPGTRRPKAPSAVEQHAEWIALLRPDGPFIGLPVLTSAFPNGVEALPQPLRERVRQAWAEFDADPDRLRVLWQDFVFGDLLRYPPSVLRDTALAEFEIEGPVKPDQVAIGPDPQAPGGRAAKLHVYRHEVEPELAARVCRDTGTPLALLTDGRFWTLVHARPGGPTSTAVFDADLWSEEPLLLRAFASLLSAQRVLAPSDRPDTLAALFARTEDEQSQVTDTLGNQVRQAVELLVGEFARLDREAGGALLADVEEREIYRAALTTLMRLVFLLYAEQRELLPVKDPVYAGGYAVTELYQQLTEDRDRLGEEVIDRREAAWFRLLATFSAIHGGCEHPELRIPAHGGSLFDLAAHAWLTTMLVTDRVVHEILDALLVLKHRGKAAERLSYTGLDVEQIGHVYEGLLEFSCKKVDEPYLGLIGRLEPELSLADVEAGADLARACDLKPHQVEKALAAQPTASDVAALHAACDNDSELTERVRPFWGLLRKDLRGEPTVFPAGSVLFTKVDDRRATGTHYTPKALAREVVEHTLAPLCYVREETGESRLRAPDELLRLKVCDPTMGSGAFLVAACDYLATRLVEAWERDGYPEGVGGTAEDVKLAAMRRVAAKCVYGVDRDDMAVELAKLSLWLVTLERNKPFGFLDHALRCGDSLIGVVNERQLERFHLDPDSAPEQGWTFGFPSDLIGPALNEAAELRQEIEDSPADDLRQIEEKAAKLVRADWLTRRLRQVADVVVGAALSTAGQSDERYRDRLAGPAKEAIDLLREPAHDSPAERALVGTVNDWLKGSRSQPIRPFHWALEFPEVLRRGGFDAIVGNPPFMKGSSISANVGRDVRDFMVERIAKNRKGSADLSVYFLLRDVELSPAGRTGLITTKTIAEGASRRVGLGALPKGVEIVRAVKSMPWPNDAAVSVALIWLAGKRLDREVSYLDGREVSEISSYLDEKSDDLPDVQRLSANAGYAFLGVKPYSPGFILSAAEARDLIEKDERNADVVVPYINGDDLNSRYDLSAGRWIIDFKDMSREAAETYPAVFDIVADRVVADRSRKKDGEYVVPKKLRDNFWLYETRRPGLFAAMRGLSRVIAMSQTSKTQIPVMIPVGQMLDQKLVVFPSDSFAELALRSSALQYWWTMRFGTPMRVDAVYTPSECCEKFPVPVATSDMHRAGENLHDIRQAVMLAEKIGLTDLYKTVHARGVGGEVVDRLRDAHQEVDRSVVAAYGWSDVDLRHDFYETRQGERYTIHPDTRSVLLTRLFQLNHEYHAEEVAQGLHSKGKGKRKAAASADPPSIAGELFPPEGALF
ncbi:Eco57I restriction-modification methylase domain-containing protein [Saccharothrix deserti]|uniref:Eco57I restriction-modification methylase domain-containing protein n=1 Tax=Saccharothrix deserti TaxID=2593674 RepID=UPI00131AC41A|nr:DNA methyltransferase [Saccharothrix deserti]